MGGIWGWRFSNEPHPRPSGTPSPSVMERGNPNYNNKIELGVTPFSTEWSKGAGGKKRETSNVSASPKISAPASYLELCKGLVHGEGGDGVFDKHLPQQYNWSYAKVSLGGEGRGMGITPLAPQPNPQSMKSGNKVCCSSQLNPRSSVSIGGSKAVR